MGKLFTREQARQFLKENNLKDADSIGDALVAQFKDLLQEALEAEMDHELGYSKYDWKNKENSNSRNGHTKKTVCTPKECLQGTLMRICARYTEWTSLLIWSAA